MVERIKISGQNFVLENSGNIKDFYKITSCIGRGKHIIHIDVNRC